MRRGKIAVVSTALFVCLSVPSGIVSAQEPDTEKNYQTVEPEIEHEWSPFEVITEPTYDQAGTEKRVCNICGKEEEKEILPLIPVREISLSCSSLKISILDSVYTVAATVNEDAEDPNLIWESDHPEIVSVNKAGGVLKMER